MNTTEYQTRYGANPDYIDSDGNVYGEDDLAESYNDMLNETGPVSIGGLFYDQAVAFKAVDPIAYRCGMLDYQDSLGWDEWSEDHDWNVDEDEDGPVCEDCSESVTDDESAVSLGKFGRILCESCGEYSV